LRTLEDAVSWILPEGAWMQFEGLSSPVQVLRGLGGGTQGQVFEVAVGGEQLALKWYLPSCLERDPHLEQRLLESIRATAPSRAFLWPITLLRPSPASLPLIRCTNPGFGYLMELRPPQFVGAVEHYGGRIEISLRQALRASFFLAEAFHSLHSKGLCYKDISLGNLFLEAATGRILICDNDNVDVDGRDLGSVLGTPGFMAPEILMKRGRPGANSDLFSLAALLFMLLTRHHPLRGQMELAIRCLDEPARRKLYGEDPVFIFDPQDCRNRPDPTEHAAALLLWPIYPRPLQELFVQSFCTGMHAPSQRALTGQWMEKLAAVLDQRQTCPACGSEHFGSQTTCWHCAEPLGIGAALRMPNGQVMACTDNELHAHHFDSLEAPRLDEPIARVVAHPSDPRLLGLRNLSDQPWRATAAGGQQHAVDPGKTCNVAALLQLDTPWGAVRLEPAKSEHLSRRL
jgi:DNA-binding helix-hairpin-helix protein with protein kinase domain